jgi:bifunctional DNA-binding transcriptional regulator/antitoxin component of YhaV-PrlF toxin-antitoxin module
LTLIFAWDIVFAMQTTVTTKNMVTIPAELSRKMGITPGCRLEWQSLGDGSDEIRVRVIPARAELARRLMGRGKDWAPGRDLVAELIDERVREDEEENEEKVPA